MPSTRTWNKLPQLHYYNPGHETVVLHATANYTPSANVAKMIRDLAYLPAWYAAPGDYVYVKDLHTPHFFSTVPEAIRPPVHLLSKEILAKEASGLPKMQAVPWGISPQSIRLFTQLKDTFSLDLDIPPWKEEYIRLTGRQTAAGCLRLLREELPGMSFPAVPRFFSSWEEILPLIRQDKSYVLKTPYSSSGRGLHWIRQRLPDAVDERWVRGALKKQQAVSLEPALQKWGDFALEFLSDGQGNVTYQGLSSFTTTFRGAYKENRLGTQEHLLKPLGSLLGHLDCIRDALSHVLQKVYGHLYAGTLGVDMMLYEEGGELRIHPCVEINMRYTMGMLALHLSGQYIHPDARGVLQVVYDNNPLHIQEIHQHMTKAWPQQFAGGKLRSGYQALCPITSQTNYCAFILVG